MAQNKTVANKLSTKAFIDSIDDLQKRKDCRALMKLMARLTGNYRRGNERQARNHPRNRR